MEKRGAVFKRARALGWLCRIPRWLHYATTVWSQDGRCTAASSGYCSELRACASKQTPAVESGPLRSPYGLALSISYHQLYHNVEHYIYLRVLAFFDSSIVTLSVMRKLHPYHRTYPIQNTWIVFGDNCIPLHYIPICCKFSYNLDAIWYAQRTCLILFS